MLIRGGVHRVHKTGGRELPVFVESMARTLCALLRPVWLAGGLDTFGSDMSRQERGGERGRGRERKSGREMEIGETGGEMVRDRREGERGRERERERRV